jgi:hypothetical protein
LFNTIQFFLHFRLWHRELESVLMEQQGSPKSMILCKPLLATLRGLVSFQLLLKILKNILLRHCYGCFKARAVLEIVEEFAMYIGGKLAFHPDLITKYTAYYPEKLSPEIAGLLQITHTPAFCLKV